MLKRSKKKSPQKPDKKVPPAPPAGCVATQREIADLFHVTVRTVQMWCREGMPKTEDGFYPVESIKAWKEKQVELRRGPRDPEKNEWETRKLKAQAQLAEAELKRKMAELIPVDEVKKQWIQRILEVKKALLSLPRRLAPQVAGLDVPAAQLVIDKRVREIIEIFARG